MLCCTKKVVLLQYSTHNNSISGAPSCLATLHCTLTDLIVTVPVPILDDLLGALGVRMPLRLRRLELLLRWSRWSNSC